MKAKSFHHKVISYGPGGYKCPCCGPNPKRRQEERRLLRRAFHRMLDTMDELDWFSNNSEYNDYEYDVLNSMWDEDEPWWYHEWLEMQEK
jgi:hypothetical protein